jgi:hypothetical protein
MGSEKHKTPTGLFFTNWKAEKRPVHLMMSGFALELQQNKLGVGWHQYSLPGYPASHSCLRLQEKTPNFYKWADEWQLMIQKQLK